MKPFFCYNEEGDSMKKMIPIVFVLGLLALLIQFFVQSLIKHHDISYSIITDNNSYMIDENFNIEDGKHVYSFKVVDDKLSYVYHFDFKHDYNKQESIIKDIKFYQYDNLACLFPIYKNGYTSDLICNYNDEQVSYSYLKQIDNSDVKKIVTDLKKEKYTVKTWKDNTSYTKEGNYKIYKENIPNNVTFTMWSYNGFYIIDKNKVEEKNYLENDYYENDRSYVVGNFLVSIDTDANNNSYYTDFYIFDVINGGKRIIDFDNGLSKNMYFNGVYDGKLYYVDLDSKIQYSIEPGYEVLSEVGNVKDGYKMVKGEKLIDVAAKDFLNDKVYFDSYISNKELEDTYNAKEIRKVGDKYYFLTDNGNFYKANVSDINNPVLLFNFKNISEWLVKGDNIMIVVDDTLYFYNDQLGLLPILENSELSYNYKNICNFIVVDK